ncbi:MAG: efflux RND transporter permease subunit [Flavobacteriales bacterium]|nr:efflux RND transporter permease subunit [Flavobacteriales bacterium]
MSEELKKPSVSSVVKEFAATSFAIKNATSIIILTIIILFGGMLAYNTMPKELFPEIVLPQIYVRTVYPGNSPVDIENLITRPLEKEIKPLKGLSKFTSTSVQDNSIIMVEFNTDVPVKQALQDVKDAVDRANSELPTDLDIDPIVMDVNLSELPIMNINLSGDYSVDDLKSYADKLKDRLELIPEISKADVRGALEREINIIVDLHRMERVQVSFDDVEQAIAYENMNISGGSLLTDGTRRAIRVEGEFRSMDEIANTIVKAEFGNIIYLRDIAEVVDGYAERNSYARLEGKTVVSVDVVKKSGENLLDATDKIMLAVAESKKKNFPSDLKVTITNDQSNQVKGQLLNLENSIYSGVILVVAVLFFFLGLRNALFVGIAIPLSMLMSFMILAAMGVTINMIVLFGLILALGMLVDNGIVVIENVYRQMQDGKSVVQAAKEGVGEIAIPIITSTLTTLAAFAPLLFWEGVMGEFMGYLPLTLIAVLGSSLFVALIINPVVAVAFMKDEKLGKRTSPLKLWLWTGGFAIAAVVLYLVGFRSAGMLAATMAVLIPLNDYLLTPIAKWFQDRALVWLENIYLRVLRASLATWRPFVLFFGSIVLLVLSIVLVMIVGPKVEFFPENDPKYVNIFIEVAQGTDIDVTNTMVLEFEKEVNAVLVPYRAAVNSVVTNIGEGSADPMRGAQAGETPNKAKITISFVEFEHREGISTSDVMRDLSEHITKRPGVSVTVEKNNEGPPVGKPVNIEVSGDDFDKLVVLTEQIKDAVDAERIPGIEGLNLDLETGKPELVVNVDRARARSFGISTGQIGGTLRTALFGKEISKYKDGEDDYPIVIKLEDASRHDLSTLLNQKVTFRDMTTGRIKQVPISAVADITYSSGLGSVKRRDQNRTITIWSNVIEGYNANEINQQIQAKFATYPVPEGFTVRFTGESEEQNKAAAFLGRAFLIAVALILLILVSQFNSAIKPLIIIGSVVFSTIGVFLGIAIFNMTISVMMTGIGIVSLAGIVVNNAIVLIDYIDLTRARRREELGMPDGSILPLPEAIACIVEAGRTRLRPVLLTAITTVLGLIPLATGMNINFYTLASDLDPNIYFGGDNVAFWGPMSWTVIFGLTFATFLTLVVVPVMYLLVEKFRLVFVDKSRIQTGG